MPGLQLRSPKIEETMTLPTLFRLDGAVALVTGAGSGIGRHACAVLAEAGATVVAADRDAAAAQETAASIHGESAVFDVTDAKAAEDAVAAIVRRRGRLDILLNSAGIALRRPAEELDPADWQKVVDVNLTGVYYASRAAAGPMLRQRSGSIVNIASIMGLTGGGLYPNVSYHATKGAVVNMTRALGVEWADRGVRVNAIAPTFVKTALTEKLFANPEMLKRLVDRTPMKRTAELADLSGAILFLASPASAMVTGHTLPVDGGWTAC
jgi:2-deoxy-D-gluconate 3-dehydrogenase